MNKPLVKAIALNTGGFPDKIFCMAAYLPANNLQYYRHRYILVQQFIHANIFVVGHTYIILKGINNRR